MGHDQSPRHDEVLYNETLVMERSGTNLNLIAPSSCLFTMYVCRVTLVMPDVQCMLITVSDCLQHNRTAIIGAIQKSMSVTSDNCTIIL